MCGKNPDHKDRKVLKGGSPPRVREKLFIFLMSCDVTGITPACAGKTKLRQLALNFVRDHPRVCGKNFREISVNKDTQGSPPRVREKLYWFDADHRTNRITPACAGKTSSTSKTSSSSRDHPRVCGKN